MRLGRAQHFKTVKNPGLGVVYFDNDSSSGYQASSSSYNWTHKVTTHANRAIFVGVSIFTASVTVSTITVGALSLTKVRSDANGSYRSEIWKGVAPSTGSQTITVTLSGAADSVSNATSYWNTDQTNPVDANNGGNGTSNPASASVITVTAKDRVFGNLAAKTASGISNQIGQASRLTNQGASGTGAGAETGSVVVPASTTLQWNGLGVGDNWAVSLVAIKVPAAAATNLGNFFLLFN